MVYGDQVWTFPWNIGFPADPDSADCVKHQADACPDNVPVDLGALRDLVGHRMVVSINARLLIIWNT